MRRFAFHFLTALITFGLGLFVFTLLYNRAIESPVIVTSNETSIARIAENPVSSDIQEIEEDANRSVERTSFTVFKPTIRKWLEGETVKNEFTEVSDEVVRELLGTGRAELSDADTGWIDDFRYLPETIDVNGDGVNELAIKNQCAPVGNCQFWLLQKQPDGYRIIMKPVPEVQTFRLKKSKTNGYFDIETRDHGDAWSGQLFIYKFGENGYDFTNCFEYSYIKTDKNGKKHELNKPILTPFHCC